MPELLRAVVVIDYQNVHLVGHELFEPRGTAPHVSLIDPLLYANTLLRVRNGLQRDGFPAAVLRNVLVFRGQPSPEQDPDGYAWNQAQAAHWRRDWRVQVTMRPLKYRYERDATGRPATDVNGRKLVIEKREKGIDVLCALACVRAARDPGTDLVILASSDSDLVPALEEVRRDNHSKIETASWFDRNTKRGTQLPRVGNGAAVWNTRLGREEFMAARDLTKY